MGNGNIISLILQDELLHKGWTAYLINQVVKEDSRFARVAQLCQAEVIQIYKDVIAEEVNVKNIFFEENFENFAELKLQINFKNLFIIFSYSLNNYYNDKSRKL